MNPNLNNALGINLTLEGIVNIVQGLTCWIANVALILVVIFVVYYGIMFLMSRGDSTKVTEARKALTWGVVGIVVILATYTIIASVANFIGGQGAVNSILPFLGRC